MSNPTIPVSISTQPATWKLKKDGLAVTANARIAPTATKASPVALFIGCPFQIGVDLERLRHAGRHRAAVLAGAAPAGRRPAIPAPCRSRRAGWLGNRFRALLRAGDAFPQVAERLGEQAGDMHLRNSELLADLSLGHVSVEPHQQQV